MAILKQLQIYADLHVQQTVQCGMITYLNTVCHVYAILFNVE